MPVRRAKSSHEQTPKPWCSSLCGFNRGAVRFVDQLKAALPDELTKFSCNRAQCWRRNITKAPTRSAYSVNRSQQMVRPARDRFCDRCEIDILRISALFGGDRQKQTEMFAQRDASAVLHDHLSQLRGREEFHSEQRTPMLQ